jgi:transcriptional regulator with XRE-family HTH domain
MYPNLKLAIFKRGIHQNRLARLLGINEAILSKIIHGYREPSDSQRRLLAGYLAEDESWLFEKYDGVKLAWVAGNPDSLSDTENDKS